MNYCIIIPAYNAAQYLERLFARIRTIDTAHDIIVVDDGSRDETAQIAQHLGAHVITHPRNLGKGASLKSAFAMVLDDNYEAAITMDADLQHPPEMIPQLVSAIEGGADLVIGNRMKNVADMPLERRISNSLSTLATSILAGRQLMDSQCGFRGIRRWILRDARLLCNRYQVESEMLVEATRMGAKIEFISIPTVYNGNKSYFNPITDTARFISFFLSYYPSRWFSAAGGEK